MINKILLREVRQHSTSILNKDGQRQREQRRRDKGDAFVQTLNKATKEKKKPGSRGPLTKPAMIEALKRLPLVDDIHVFTHKYYTGRAKPSGLEDGIKVISA